MRQHHPRDGWVLPCPNASPSPKAGRPLPVGGKAMLISNANRAANYTIPLTGSCLATRPVGPLPTCWKCLAGLGPSWRRWCLTRLGTDRLASAAAGGSLFTVTAGDGHGCLSGRGSTTSRTAMPAGVACTASLGPIGEARPTAVHVAIKTADLTVPVLAIAEESRTSRGRGTAGGPASAERRGRGVRRSRAAGARSVIANRWNSLARKHRQPLRILFANSTAFALVRLAAAREPYSPAPFNPSTSASSHV